MNQDNGTTVDATAIPSPDPCEHCANSQRLETLAEKLERRGLYSRLVTYSRGQPDSEYVAEIVVTNPAARHRGEVHIDDDGAVTWEFFGDLGEAGAEHILDDVTNALRATGVRFGQEGRPSTELSGTIEQQLIYLNTHWGRHYSFTVPDRPCGTWKAKAKFGAQHELEDSSAAGLLAKVRDHYQANRPEE
jgi:hypothetical protein